jgi:RNA-directed DNA polymerase
VRKCGLPTVLDRLLPQALLHVLPPAWDKTWSDHRDGLRPQRSAPQATARAQQSLPAGSDWVVDLDRAKCFARVHPEKLLRLGKGRRADRRGSPRIDRSRKAGVLPGDGFAATGEGTPHGGPLSPR